ncbi:MAG: hypothetical protein Tsb005_19020 [Gammaproteobacteria bacterium]
MPLIQPPVLEPKRLTVKHSLTETLLAEVDAYCAWAGLKRQHFIEAAVESILQRDKEWREYRKQLRDARPAPETSAT